MATTVRTRRAARNRESARIRETTFGVEPEDQRSPGLKEVGNDEKELLDSLSSMKLDITYKERALLDQQQKVIQKKDKAKRDVQNLFDALHELLERKEVEMNEKVDEMYEDIERPISESIEKYNKLKDPVNKTLDEHSNGKTVPMNVLENLRSVTESALNSGDNIPENIDSIPSLAVNSNTKQVIDRLNFGTFSDASVSENVVRTASPEETDLDSVDYIEDSADSINEGQAQAIDFTETTQPSAPLLELDNYNTCDTVEGTEDGEAPPPPYWEAIGLSGPEVEESYHQGSPPVSGPPYPSEPSPQYSQYDTRGAAIVQPASPQPITIPYLPNFSSHYDTNVTANTPEEWHSFPAKRHRDYRKPLYIALTWDLERICLADRNNKKVKFFSCYGDVITEMNISSGEMHDIAFLESCNGEARYIITLPKERLLLLVAVFSDHSTKLVRKIQSRTAGYSCICRGPFEHTLIGAVIPSLVAQYEPGQARVELFDFDGNVLNVFDHTLLYGYFQYPRSITSVGEMIVVADWKLSLVASFYSHGAEAGTYKGTASSPLINPLDLAVDKYGKVMIVDGEFATIHVITTECHPVEIIRLPGSGSVGSNIKLVAFDMLTQWMAVVKSTGNIVVYKFQDGYRNLRPGMLPVEPGSPLSTVPVLQEPESLPYVEGMLPTTIASIGRQRRSNRIPQFYL